MNSIRNAGKFLALLMLAWAAPALAIDSICVQDTGALFSAMTAATSPYDPKRIMVSQGTYDLGNLENYWYFKFAPGTSLEGGYSNACTQRQIGAGNTVLLSTYPAYLSIFPDGDLLLEGLTFQIQGGVAVGSTPYTGWTSGSQITIRRNVFRQSRLSVGMENDPDVGADISIVDNLFHNNTAADNSSCVVELVTTGGSADYVLVNNTVVGNAGGGVCMRDYPDVDDNLGDGSLFAYNNIFYNNSGTDLYTNTPNLELGWNTYGTFGGPAPTTEFNTLHSDPKLDASYHPIASPPSPVINTGAFDGNPDLTLHDLDGGPRVVGTRVDRGAYESNINDSFVLKVKNTDNGGTDSLRAAIASANANGGGLIFFEIPGDCTPAHVITLTSALPAITAPITVDGYTQAGASVNHLDVGDDAEICVVLDGANVVGNGFLVAPNPPANTQLTVKGIGFSGFVDAAINLSGGANHYVQGNHIGGKVNGVTLAPSGYGIYVAEGVSNVAVGGDDVADRNIVGDANLDGIHIHGPANAKPAATKNAVTNNYVGVGWNGLFVAHGNTKNGIHVLGSNNPITGNVVGFNGSDGIDLDGASATGNNIERNAIGTGLRDPFSDTDIGNGEMGVRVENGSHDNKIRSNTIMDNAAGGVRVTSGHGNTIRSNNIALNGGAQGLGIDLAASGVDDIDDDSTVQAMQEANRGLNYPTLTMAAGVEGASAVIRGELLSTPGTYYIDVYANPTCNPSGYGEGRFWLGTTKTTIGPSASFADFSTYVSIDYVPPGWAISVTATDAVTNASPGNTSEFSRCKVLVNDRIFAAKFEP